MSAGNHEESGYNLDLGLLTISYELHVSYPRRRGLLGTRSPSRPIYFNNPYPELPETSSAMIGENRQLVTDEPVEFDK